MPYNCTYMWKLNKQTNGPTEQACMSLSRESRGADPLPPEDTPRPGSLAGRALLHKHGERHESQRKEAHFHQTEKPEEAKGDQTLG